MWDVSMLPVLCVFLASIKITAFRSTISRHLLPEGEMIKKQKEKQKKEKEKRKKPNR